MKIFFVDTFIMASGKKNSLQNLFGRNLKEDPKARRRVFLPPLESWVENASKTPYKPIMFV